MENEKLDFFDASRIVAGTERRLRYRGISDDYCREWMRYVIRLDSGCAVLMADENVIIWPLTDLANEKCWQVEPLVQTTSVILTVKGRQVYIGKEKDHGINILRASESTLLNWSRQLIKENEIIDSVADTEKPQEVFVWVCGYKRSGLRYLFDHKPVKIDGLWECAQGDEDNYTLSENVLLPSEPTKYRLVPADDPWPWRKFEPDEMPDKDFEFLGLDRHDNWTLDRWVINDYGKRVPKYGSVFDYYIPIDEIPRPELNDA